MQHKLTSKQVLWSKCLQYGTDPLITWDLKKLIQFIQFHIFICCEKCIIILQDNIENPTYKAMQEEGSYTAISHLVGSR